MSTKEFFGFLFKVISSWQVILITVALVIYFSLVFYVARLYHPPRSFGLSFSFSRKPRKEKAQHVELPETSDDDNDIGLE